MNNQIYESQRTPNTLNIKRTSPGHIILKFSKVKDKVKILKATREQKPSYTSKPPQGYQQTLQQKHSRIERWGTLYSKCWKKRSGHDAYYMWQVCSTKVRRVIRPFPNKSCSSSSPLELPYNKCLRKFFRLKLKDNDNHENIWKYKPHCKGKDIIKLIKFRIHK